MFYVKRTLWFMFYVKRTLWFMFWSKIWISEAVVIRHDLEKDKNKKTHPMYCFTFYYQNDTKNPAGWYCTGHYTITIVHFSAWARLFYWICWQFLSCKSNSSFRCGPLSGTETDPERDHYIVIIVIISPFRAFFSLRRSTQWENLVDYACVVSSRIKVLDLL